MRSIDINCDMGESFGNYRLGNDEALLPYITSANIACGFHAGDPVHIEKTLALAVQQGVQIGAHPSYPDLGGFGRRKMEIPPEELRALVKYQVAAIKGMAESLGGKLRYVKPHGALYNSIAQDPEEGQAILQALREIDPGLVLMGLAGSSIEEQARALGTPFVAEAFADRRYEADGSLRSRMLPGSVIGDPQVAAEQVVSLVKAQSAKTLKGTSVPVKAQSICIHGDNPHALEILQAITQALVSQGIQKKAFNHP